MTSKVTEVPKSKPDASQLTPAFSSHFPDFLAISPGSTPDFTKPPPPIAGTSNSQIPFQTFRCGQPQHQASGRTEK